MAAPRARPCRYQPTVEDWQEFIGFDFTVGATSVESHASRLIYGAFRVDYIAGRVGVGATNSARLILAADYDDVTSATELTVSGPTGREILTDVATRFLASLDLTTLWTTFPIGHVHRQGVTRLMLVGTNTSAGAQNYVGNIQITHLTPQGDCPYY